MGVNQSILQTTCACIALFPSIFMLIAFWLQAKHSKLSQAPGIFQISVYLAFLACIPFTCFLLVHGPILLLSKTMSLSSFLSTLRDIIYSWVYVALSTLIPLLYLLRLCTTFEDSILALQNKTIIIYLILIFIDTTFAVIGCMYGIDSINTPSFFCLFAATSISIPTTICICSQFGFKLFHLIDMQRNSVKIN